MHRINTMIKKPNDSSGKRVKSSPSSSSSSAIKNSNEQLGSDTSWSSQSAAGTRGFSVVSKSSIEQLSNQNQGRDRTRPSNYKLDIFFFKINH